MCSQWSSPSVEERAAAAREALEALGSDGVEWHGPGSVDVSSTTRRVLSVDSLPDAQAGVQQVLGEWRSVLGIDAELHFIERTRPDTTNAVVAAVRARLPGGPALFDRDVVAAVRDAGWTIVAIDRFDVELDGATERWVELRATDVIAQVERDSA